jgi:hypothetical protein
MDGGIILFERITKNSENSPVRMETSTGIKQENLILMDQVFFFKARLYL